MSEYIDIRTVAKEPIKVFGPDARPYGLKYLDWTAKWWQWALSIPKEYSPLSNDGGMNAPFGQSGPVWFLAGTFGGKVSRACKIPVGKAILFPVSNHESSFSEFPNLKTEIELKACSKEDIDKVTTLVVKVDGIVLPEFTLKTCRLQSSLFDIVLPQNNVLGLPPGSTKAVSDGYWVFLQPLSEGTHDIYFMGSCRTDALRTEVSYHIEVIG